MSSSDLLRFNIQDGQVISVFEFDDGVWERESIDFDETYTMSGNDVIKTEQDGDHEEVTTFSDPDGDGTYRVVAKTSTGGDDDDGIHIDDSENRYIRIEGKLFEREDDEYFPFDTSVDATHFVGDDEYRVIGGQVYEREEDDVENFSSSDQDRHDKYRFDITDGQVVAVFEFDDGRLEQEDISENSYTVEGDTVIEREQYANGVEEKRYQDLDGDGFYTQISSEWVVSDDDTSSTSRVGNFSLQNRLVVEGGDNDDFVLLSSNSGNAGRNGADNFVFRDLGKTTVVDFSVEEGDRLVFDTGLGLQGFEDIEPHILEIRLEDQKVTLDFGENGSITLIGLSGAEASLDLVDVMS
jgi:hypothetical protein